MDPGTRPVPRRPGRARQGLARHGQRWQRWGTRRVAGRGWVGARTGRGRRRHRGRAAAEGMGGGGGG
eukprot:scaffold3099_cov100-Isochrysis_galbana.AAC.18